MAARGEFDTPPDGRGHQAVVNDVQCGHLIVTFAHHKEYGVKEFCEFREVVPPASLSHLEIVASLNCGQT